MFDFFNDLFSECKNCSEATSAVGVTAGVVSDGFAVGVGCCCAVATCVFVGADVCAGFVVAGVAGICVCCVAAEVDAGVDAGVCD